MCIRDRFKLIASFLRPTSGEVRLKGERISGLAPHIAARKGVVRTFQETTIFKSMSVRDNVVIAHHLRSNASLVGFYLGTAAARRDEAAEAFGQAGDFEQFGHAQPFFRIASERLSSPFGSTSIKTIIRPE